MNNPTTDRSFTLLAPGDLFQVVNASHKSPAWIGCIIFAEEICKWGVKGSIRVPHDGEVGIIPGRFDWFEIEYVGRAVLVPAASAEAPGHPDLFTTPTP